MQISRIRSRVLETDADAIAVGAFEDRPLSGAAAEVDAALNGAIRGLIERREFVGRSYELAPLLVKVGQAKQVLVVGPHAHVGVHPRRRSAGRRRARRRRGRAGREVERAGVAA